MEGKKFKTAACTAFLKTLMMMFNLVFFLIGFALLVAGFYGYKVFKQFFVFAPSTSIYFPIIFIGLFMMFVGAYAFWCTPKGTVWLLNVYSILIFVLFLSIFSISILFSVKHDSWKGTLKQGIDRSINNYQNDTRSIDFLQMSIKCCGSENYTDWFNTQWANQEKRVPKSCCIKKQACVNEGLETSANATDIYQKGCYAKVESLINEKFIIIIAIGFISSFIVLGGSFLTCLLAQNLNKHRYEQME
ncbi:unnamed protein product [Brachionus calyciflorus]|uniref:Tetraspanin n=1 Tax=Brachionus calyciflorus TaxID=104777 RepID=A0A814AK40_9BILA|nr:unnamed protein product [Brachionus calyciflorus]